MLKKLFLSSFAEDVEFSIYFNKIVVNCIFICYNEKNKGKRRDLVCRLQCS